MSAIAERPTVGQQLEAVLVQGDLGKLSAEQRVSYYKAVCDSVGLNPMTRPFDYLQLSGRTVLYAKRDATDQLRKIHGVSVKITHRETIDGVYVVTAGATDKDGRSDESTGAVSIGGLKGEAMANALMKAETKAKRRVTLSICGLGLLDETEVETIPGARHVPETKQLASADEDHPDAALVNELIEVLTTCRTQEDADALKKQVAETGAKLTDGGRAHLNKCIDERRPKLPASKITKKATAKPTQPDPDEDDGYAGDHTLPHTGNRQVMPVH